MNPTLVGMVVFVSTFVGALVGMQLQNVVPEHHLGPDSRETMKGGIGLIATMTALVLGLVTASAKSSFDAVDAELKQTATEILTLDRLLARYGSETSDIREGLQHALGVRIEMIWPQGSSRPAHLDSIRSGTAPGVEGLADAIGDLEPRDDSQRALQSRARELAEALLQTRWIALAGTEPSVPMLFLVILTFWLTITFASFGMFALRNTTVIAVLLVYALCVGSAVFLLLEMDGPFDGLLRVSAEPLRNAYEHLNQ